MLSAFYLNHFLHFPPKLVHRAIWISFFFTNTSSVSWTSRLFVLFFHLIEKRIFLENTTFLFSVTNSNVCSVYMYVYIMHIMYIFLSLSSCLLCIYSYPHHNTYSYPQALRIYPPYIYRLSPRPSALFLLLNLTNCSPFHVVQWTSFLHADGHLNLGYFPWVTEEFSTLTIVLSSATNTIILDHFSIHKKDSPYDKHVKEAV